MELKFKVDNDGNGYAALIDPSTKEHKKSASLSLGQEVVLSLPDVTDASEVTFSDVAVSESPPHTGAQAPPEGEEQPAGAEGGEESSNGGSGGETPAEEPQGGEEAPTTSAASEKPLYHVAEGATVPEGFTPSGLETVDNHTLYHFEGDEAGESARFETANVEGVDLYADADDNEVPVCPAAKEEEQPAS